MIDTRAEAHEKARTFCKRLKNDIRLSLVAKTQTGSELAERLGVDVLSIRPRRTEMYKDKEIYVIGTRKNRKGGNERVFRMTSTFYEDWYDNETV